MKALSNVSTVLITGGGSGIGRATAEKFLAEGWQVIVVGRRFEPLAELAKTSDRVLAQVCDVTSPASVNQLIVELQKRPDFFDTLCVVVNNAGIVEWKSIEDTTVDIWRKIFDTNLLGAVRITKSLLPNLKKNRGSIINVSSNLGLKPIPMTSAYSAVKAAMINWTQTLALELAASGVRANCICPGIVDTPIHSFHQKSTEEKASYNKMHPLGRMGLPSDIAHGIYAASSAGSEWMTGAVITIDGGLNLKAP